MKNIILILLFVTSTVFANDQKPVSAEDILQKTADKLASLKTVKYKYHQEYNYKSESYFAESNAESFLDFAPIENTIGLNFRFENQKSLIVYNGSEVFSLNKNDKTIEVESKPKSERLTSSSYLQYALPMWRNILPKILADKSIVKYIRDAGMNTYVVEFELNKAFIDSGSGTKIHPMTLDRKSVYRLTVDNKTFLPIEAYRGNSANEDFNKVVFSDIIENPSAPSENSWYYSTYLNEYKYAEPPKDNLIKSGTPAHELNLPLFGTNKKASLNDYKGKVVLLEFWIFHCGWCHVSVPNLNALQEKYKDRNFSLLSVNVTDSEKLIQLFIDKTKAQFPILYNGEAIAKQYGVVGYPTVVLLSKDGVVIYSGSYDAAKIDELIKLNL